jgi:hypothetical protein
MDKLPFSPIDSESGFSENHRTKVTVINTIESSRWGDL